MFFCCGKISDVIEPKPFVPEPEPVAVEDVVPEVEELESRISKEDAVLSIISGAALLTAICLFYYAANGDSHIQKEL